MRIDHQLARPTRAYGTPLRRSAPFRAALAAAIAIGASACAGDGAEAGAENEAGAPDGQPARLSPPDAEALERQMTLMSELRSIDQALSPLRERASQDPELQAKEAALVAQVEAAMEAIDPNVGATRARFDSLRTEFTTAQQSGEEVEAQSLAGELQSLQMSLQETQSQALQREDVATAIEAFRTDLFAWMRANDPAADSLLNRAEELNQALQAMAPDAAPTR